MLSIVKTDGVSEKKLIAQLKDRSGEVDRKVTAAVSDIIEQVRINGDKAVAEYTLKFDGKVPECMEISKDEILESLTLCDSDFVKGLKRAAKNI